ncbi:hypothetical protein ACA910_000094 [Epithemia clementina (nom. ined.)]
MNPVEKAQILLRVVWLLFLAGSWTVTNAICQVKDENGVPWALDKLPEQKAYYTASMDRLVCQPNGCRHWTVSDCFLLQCVGSRACQDLNAVNNQGVNCKGFYACKDATMIEPVHILCGTDTINSCHKTSVITTGEVWCIGPGACGSPDAEFANDPTVFQLGAKGYVHCNYGQGSKSCQNLVIHVNHARRACLSQSKDHCAVICEGNDKDTECDPKTIEFKIVES